MNFRTAQLPWLDECGCERRDDHACGCPMTVRAPNLLREQIVFAGVAAFLLVLPHTPQLADVLQPGARVLLDAHNAYPEAGRWADRIDRALATGVPLAIERDLYWRHERGNSYVPVVAHESDALAGAPTFEAYFFDKIRPTMERALVENRRNS